MKTQKTLVVAIALSLGLSACKPVNHDTVVSSDASSEVKKLRAKLETQNNELNRVRGLLRDSERKVQASASTNTGNSLGGNDDMLPPNAKAGECYARLLIPATYKTISKDVLTRRASSKIEVIPATYTTVEEQIVVKEASEKVETIPAEYGWVEEQVLVSAESQKLKSFPAEYGTETEQVLVKPAYSTWKKGRGPIEKLDNSTGEIMCLVEVPAEYKTVSRRVVVREARTETVTIPAVYKTVKKKVMTKPPQIVRTTIPAEYDTIKVKKVLTPPRENTIEIPAVYDTVVQQELVTPAEMQWRPILCETNTTKDIVVRIQRALDNAGYNPGDIDGVLGASTMSALSAFQADNGMAKGQLTMSAIKKLGVL